MTDRPAGGPPLESPDENRVTGPTCCEGASAGSIRIHRLFWLVGSPRGTRRKIQLSQLAGCTRMGSPTAIRSISQIRFGGAPIQRIRAARTNPWLRSRPHEPWFGPQRWLRPVASSVARSPLRSLGRSETRRSRRRDPTDSSERNLVSTVFQYLRTIGRHRGIASARTRSTTIQTQLARHFLLAHSPILASREREPFRAEGALKHGARQHPMRRTYAVTREWNARGFRRCCADRRGTHPTQGTGP